MLYFPVLNGFCQSASLLMGARSNGLAYASSCLSDPWSLFANAGGLAGIASVTGALSYQVHPSIRSFDRVAAVAALPFKPGVAGVGLFRFGDDLYSEQAVRLGFASQLGITALGAQLSYLQYHAEGFGTRGAVTLGLGGITRLTPWLSVGVSITNLNQPVISNATGERVPALLTAGIALRPSGLVLIVIEIEKDLDYAATWRTGLEYTAHKKFFARTGFALHPNAAFLGVGFKAASFTFDYAIQFQQAPGMSHQATVGYRLVKRKKS